MEQINEAVKIVSPGGKRLKKGNKAPWIILGVVLAVLAAAYAGLCAYANSQETFYPNSPINFIDVSGLTPEEAQAKLGEALPAYEVPIYSEDQFYSTHSAEDPLVPLMTVTLAELGFDPDTISHAVPYETWVSTLWFLQSETPFFSKGWDYFQHLMGNRGGAIFSYYLEGEPFGAAVDSIQKRLTVPAVDTSFSLEENAICIVNAKDGCFVDRSALKEALSQAGNSAMGVTVPLEPDFAEVLTAQEIYAQAAGEMKNAGYDAETDSITPEKAGAEFDVAAAQAALDAAEPGEAVRIPAVIQFPAVTAAELEAVLFRDVLGEYTTEVSGTTGRRGNVKLSSESINNYVMNTGDVFSYNEAVGQRTAANGYSPAPAYVRGETVDEIGGGICQTSSTLYLACLLGDLEITERYPHRYAPSYVPLGMDATVSWGGPDYKFTNDTDYPIKIVTEYKNHNLTVKILGTNADGGSAKMRYEYLGKTDWETVYQEDATVVPGTQVVKTDPYTGHKVKTYHTLYDKDGNVIDSHYEATSDYKVRNKVILVAPGELPAAEQPAVPTVTPIPLPEDPAPVDPMPVDPVPEDPTPVDPAPVDPVPEDPTPVDPVPEAPEDPAAPEVEAPPVIVIPELTETPAEEE